MNTLPQAIWKGHYFDGQTPTRHPVTLTLMSGGLHIAKADGSTMFWLYEHVRQTQGSHAGEQVRLENVRNGLEAIIVEDRGVLAAVQQIAPGVAFGANAPAQPRQHLRLMLIAAAGVILVAATLYLWGIPLMANAAAALVPPQWEAQFGQSVLDNLAPPASRCEQPAGTEALNQIVATLTVTQPGLPYTFDIVVAKQPVVNAFAAPGGHIVVFSGMLEKTASPAELAGVLAHEIQHVIHRHVTKALLRQMSMSLLLRALTGDASGSAAGLQAAGTLGALRYSRQDEEEADLEGMKMLQAARIDPSGMIQLFVKLEKENGEISGIKYLSSHPDTAERIVRLKVLAAQAHYTPVTLLPDFAWSRMQKVCSPGTE